MSVAIPLNIRLLSADHPANMAAGVKNNEILLI
jgi:hypothetical protein